MQAIRTHYIPATNYKPSRIKASCERGSIVISCDSGAGSGRDDPHTKAVRALVARFVAEDAGRYGSNPGGNPWSRPFVSGGLSDGSMAHVFIPVP